MPVLKHIRIATRNSPLAMWQAEHVRTRLQQHYPGLTVELVGISTAGDKILDTPLGAAGGKGLFTKELEDALINNRADIAVHSMKDVTVDVPQGLTVPVIMERADARDVLIARSYKYLADLPAGASIGTSSLRRECQIRALRPDLGVNMLRGNVGTRLRKLDEGKFDAIILAAAGVMRLGFGQRISQYLDIDTMLPSPGQGAIGIETRAGDKDVQSLIAPLDHAATHLEVKTERAFSRRLYGGCRLPVAAHARIAENSITLSGLVGRVDGTAIISNQISGAMHQGEALGVQLAEQLIKQGADEILSELAHG